MTQDQTKATNGKDKKANLKSTSLFVDETNKATHFLNEETNGQAKPRGGHLERLRSTQGNYEVQDCLPQKKYILLNKHNAQSSKSTKKISRG